MACRLSIQVLGVVEVALGGVIRGVHIMIILRVGPNLAYLLKLTYFLFQLHVFIDILFLVVLEVLQHQRYFIKLLRKLEFLLLYLLKLRAVRRGNVKGVMGLICSEVRSQFVSIASGHERVLTLLRPACEVKLSIFELVV